MTTCKKCGKTFDELERWPTCPHPHQSLPNPLKRPANPTSAVQAPQVPAAKVEPKKRRKLW